VAEGEIVTLFGTGADGGPTATEWANLTGTIDYEIVTGMYRPRIERIYLGSP
jgi:alanine racemase